jgi:Kef-type K+ transport system membrane component KefB
VTDTGRLLIDLFFLFAAARLAEQLCLRVRQPAVVGEILAGILLGPHLLRVVYYHPYDEVFSQLGVVVLLFVVGLETEPRRLWRIGGLAALVTSGGVLLSFGLGFAAVRLLHGAAPAALYVATALAATSVGITARVFRDLGQLGSRVATVVMGAAILDDVLAMVVLAVVSAATAGGVSAWEILLVIGETVAFVGLAVLLGRPAVHRLAPRLARLDTGRDPVFALALALCFLFSALAEVIGLAAIIGAFFAGILFAETQEASGLRRSMRPIYEFLVPIFFVLLGVRVDLSRLAGWSAAGLLLLVFAAAVVGKLLGCGLAARRMGRRNALAVGAGMLPRGEISMVVALTGLARGLIGSEIYSAIVITCLLTSLLAPPLLGALLVRPVPDEDIEDTGIP